MKSIHGLLVSQLAVVFFMAKIFEFLLGFKFRLHSWVFKMVTAYKVKEVVTLDQTEDLGP